MNTQTITFGAAVAERSAAMPEVTALLEGDRSLAHAELADLVSERARSFDLPTRSLVVLTGERSVEYIVTYLALHAAGHVPLLAASHIDELAERWAPAGVVHADRDGTDMRRLAHEPQELHPDLGLLLCTSGSTGAPKLVRLSHRNLISNALSIAEYLDLGDTDRAITTLPLHYCYGLSVLHSHLLAGASVVLSTASVVDPCFHAALATHHVTNFAGVPHTFELMEQCGFEPAMYPDLRFITQAGGRMPGERVDRWAAALGRAGAELFVMYGQTEATARMAYLPPRLLSRRPGSIGVPIPGGSFELRPHPGATDENCGEIIYRGPNVMMGYAVECADLASGHELDELPTGDLARFHPEDGVYEIIGRASRFVKPFGLRIELDSLEQRLAAMGWTATVTGDDHHLVVAVSEADPEVVRAAVASLTTLPVGRVLVLVCESLPRTTTGKVDYKALLSLATEHADHRVAPADSVSALFAEVLRKNAGPTDTFASLGGDSLSYVECSIRLEQLLGNPPADWHLRSVAELEQVTRTKRTPWIDTSVLLRAISICAIVAAHMKLTKLQGGGHLLLALVGYNFAKFQLSIADTRARLVAAVRSAARVAIPASLWIGINMLVAGTYSIGCLLLVNNYTGSAWRRNGRWDYWILEVFVHLTLAASLLLAVPAIRRAERRFPFGFALALLLPLLAFRFELVEFGGHYNYLFRTHTVAWFFVLGWAIHQARQTWQRLVVSVLPVLVIPGFFGQPQREWFIIAGLTMVLWLPAVPLPRVLHLPLEVIAAASLWIFLVHWQVWPPLDRMLVGELSLVLTVVAGVAVWWLTRLLRPALSTRGDDNPLTKRRTVRWKTFIRARPAPAT